MGSRTIHWSCLCKQDPWCSKDPLWIDYNDCLAAAVWSTWWQVSMVRVFRQHLTLISANVVLHEFDGYRDSPQPHISWLQLNRSGVQWVKTGQSWCVGVSRCVSKVRYLRTDKNSPFEGVAASRIAAYYASQQEDTALCSIVKVWLAMCASLHDVCLLI